MDLKIVPHRTFKKIFFNFLVVCILLVAAGYFLYKQRISLFPSYLGAYTSTNVLIYALVGIMLVFGFYFINNKKKLRSLQNFEEKITFYEKLYTRRLWWHVISCLTSVFFLQLTFHYIFIYFGLFDLLSLLSAFPSRELLKKDLDESELIFN